MEKKELTRIKILDAALSEFATNGYKAASTNSIYQIAQVSKGTVFVYFPKKADLFFDVYHRAMLSMMEEYNKQDFSKYPDVFEKLTAISLWKMEYFALHPQEGKVMLEAISDPPAEVKEKIYLLVGKLNADTPAMMFENVDMNRFKDGYTKEDVMKYFMMAIDGLRSRYLGQPLTIEYLASIKDQCMEFIKIVLKGMEK